MDEIYSKATERWLDNEVEEFLGIYAEDDIGHHQRGHHSELYKTISLRLAQNGIYHTPKQCREKIKKLKQDYKKAKEQIQLGDGTRRTSKWFHYLDLILGKRTTLSNAVDTMDNEPCDAKIEDNHTVSEDNKTVTNNFVLDSALPEFPEPQEMKLEDLQTKTDKWTHSDVAVLLSIYAEDEVQKDFGMFRHNESLYQRISQRLAEQGIHHSSKHCRDKIKKMKQDYKRIKEQESAGKQPSKPRWFHSFDAILSSRADSTFTTGTDHCGSLLLEVISDDSGSNSHNGQVSSLEDEHNEVVQVDLPDLMDSPGTSAYHEPASTSLGHQSSAQGKRKREPELLGVIEEMQRRDQLFLATLQSVEEAHMEVLRQELDQRERYFQMIAAREAREAEAREREYALLRDEAAEMRRQQEVFQQGFLNILQRLVTVLDKKEAPTAPPLD